MSGAIIALLLAREKKDEKTKEEVKEVKEAAKEEAKEETKEAKEETKEVKEETKETKEEAKEELKEEAKEEAKEESKEEVEEEAKEEVKEEEPKVMPSPLHFPPLPAAKSINFQHHGHVRTILQDSQSKFHALAKFHLLLAKSMDLVLSHPAPNFYGEYVHIPVVPVEVRFTKEDNRFATQRTSLSNTRCSERVLKAFTTNQPDLHLNSDEVKIFASKPLESLISENIEMAKMRTDGMVEKLPIDVSGVAASKTKIAQNTLNRMQEDMSLAFNEAQKKLVPHLQYLKTTDLSVLREEVAKLQKRPRKAKKTRTLQPTVEDTKKSEEIAAQTAETREGSKILQSVMSHLRQLQDKLKEMQRARVHKIQTELKQVNALANDTSRSGTKQEQLIFSLQQTTGHRQIFSFETCASVLISSNPLSDLKNFNPFITDEQSEEILNSIAQVMLETVMVGQLNNCMASVLQLVNHLFDLLQIEVAVLMGVDGENEESSSGFTGISKEMLQFAMEGAKYVASDAYEKLRRMKAFLETAAKEENLKELNAEDRMKLSFSLFHHSEFDEKTCLELIKAELNPSALLNLANRRCYWDSMFFFFRAIFFCVPYHFIACFMLARDFFCSRVKFLNFLSR